MRNPTGVRLAIMIPLLLLAVLSTALSAQSNIPTNNTLTTPTQECTTLFGSSSTGTSTTTSVPVPGYQGFPTSTFQNAIAASLIALLISFDIVGIAYVISKLVPSSQIRNWLPREYWELTKSAILIAVIFSVITFISGVGVLLLGQTPNASTAGTTNINSTISAAENYLCTVNNQANFAIDKISPLVIGLGVIENPGNGNGLRITYLGIPIPPVVIPTAPYLPVFRSGITFYPFSSLLENVNFVYLGQFMSVFIDYILFLLVPIKLIFSGQIILLPYMVSIGLVVLLPAGLILRALPFTRGVGGTLIAYAIGFSVIWPGILILFNAPVSSYYCGILSGGGNSFCTTTITASPSSISQSLTGVGLAQNITSSCTAQQLGVGTADFDTATCSQLASTAASWWPNVGTVEIVSAWESISSLYPTLNLFLQYGTYLIVQLAVIFILDLMLFYALTDNIARMLGGTLKLSLGRRLKLV